MFQDKVLTCADCGKEFTWEATEQHFSRAKGFMSEPSHCRECRQAIHLRRAMRAASAGREEVSAAQHLRQATSIRACRISDVT